MGASFCYEAQGWGCCRIVGDGNTVRFYPAGWYLPDTPFAQSQPSTDEWGAFWALVESLGAWTWQGNYGERVMCGTPWSLRIERDGKVMWCEGNGGEGGDDDHAPPGFARLLEAMKELARSH